MTYPKTIPFHRVRVMVMAEAGALVLPARHALPEPRRALDHAWRDPIPRKAVLARAVLAQAATPGTGSAEPAGAAGPASRDADGANPAQPLPQRDAAADALPLAEAGAEPAPEADAEPGSALPDEPLAVAPPPSPQIARISADAAVRAGSPLSAVARAVVEVETVKTLAAMLAEICSDEAALETGPWDFSLPLQSLGLGETLLDLHLTLELLSLRFHRLGPGVAQLLSRHRSTLLDLLRQQLPPRLAIDIAIVDV